MRFGARVDSAKLHCCDGCVVNAPLEQTHKETLPKLYVFNRCELLGDLKIADSVGERYSCLSIADRGTTLQIITLVWTGEAAPSPNTCLRRFLQHRVS